MRNGIFHLLTGTAIAIALSVSSAYAQKKYDTGATDTEIKIGQTIPLSGPASAYGTIGKTQAAYIKMINDQGGVNGRKINFIQYDDAYSPPKTVEQVRKLVESDEVLLTFQLIGTPPNAAVQKYLNVKKVPQLFAATGASRFTDPKNFPWTMGFNPNYRRGADLRPIYPEELSERQGRRPLSERRSRQGLSDRPQGRAGRQGQDHGRRRNSYESSDPTIDSQILQLKSAGADLFFSASTPKFAARRSRRRPNSAGIRCISSTSTPPGRRGDEAGGARSFEGHHQRQLWQGPARSDLEGRPRDEKIFRLHGEVLSGGRQEFAVQHLWLQQHAVADSRSQAVRRRPYPREHHEAGD